MNLVYYSHSYRRADTAVVQFFLELMSSEGLTPSLDPPSDRLNSAKPERHLRSTDGMIVILTTREGGVSQYILYELALCLRSQKPLLVFVEDVLPDGLVPPRVLQRRFSRRGYLRQIREHRHAIQLFKTYVGDQPPPKYQPAVHQRNCLLVGTAALPSATRSGVSRKLAGLGYAPVEVDSNSFAATHGRDHLDSASTADLAVCYLNDPHPASHFLLGALRSLATPTILLTGDERYPFHREVPLEYQPRVVDGNEPEALAGILEREVAILEEEYVDLDDQKEVARYAQLLIHKAPHPDGYSDDLRQVFVQELVVGPKIGEIIMSHDTTTVTNYGGIVNVKARLDGVVQRIEGSSAVPADRRAELAQLFRDLQVAVAPVVEKDPPAAERVVKSAEMAAAEAQNVKPSPAFMKITLEGLKEAASAVKAIAPDVLEVATQIAVLLVR